VIAVRDRLAEFGDAEVAVVTFAVPERLAAYRAHLDLPFDVVADVDRTLYALLGAERGTNRQVWSLGTLRLYARLLRRGRRLQRPTGDDIHQLGADAVVGRDGVLRMVSLPATPDARPPIDDLLAALD
jgi:hypothetical protein